MGKRFVTIAAIKAKAHHAKAFGSKLVPALVPPPASIKKHLEQKKKLLAKKVKPSVSLNNMGLPSHLLSRVTHRLH